MKEVGVYRFVINIEVIFISIIVKKQMEGNIKIIDKMLDEYGVQASKEAKEALINFSVLFG